METSFISGVSPLGTAAARDEGTEKRRRRMGGSGRESHTITAIEKQS